MLPDRLSQRARLVRCLEAKRRTVDSLSSLFARGGTAGEDVRWLDDRLPDLPRVRALGTTFDLILASAVLMHLDGDDLGRAMATFAVLASADGRVVASLRGRAPGEPAALFHDHSDAAVLGAAEEAGLSLVDRWTAADALGRDRTWRGFVLAQR